MSFQISMGSQGSGRLGSCLTNCMRPFYVCFSAVLLSFKTSPHVLQLVRRMTQRCFVAKLQEWF